MAFLVHGPIILVSEAWKNGKGDCEPRFFTEWYIPLPFTSSFPICIPFISFSLEILLRRREKWVFVTYKQFLPQGGCGKQIIQSPLPSKNL